MRKSISFGNWNGEPLEWLVLEEDDSSLVLWCKRSVANMEFNKNLSGYYSESDVRRFLSEEFYEKAFSDAEKSRILTTELDCTERQTYYGAVGVGATAYRREPLNEQIYLLSVREIMITYALKNDEIYRSDCSMFWTRSPDGNGLVSLVYCGKGILNGESPYEYESRSYDHTTGMIDSMTFPYSAFSDRTNSVVPAIRIKKV